MMMPANIEVMVKNLEGTPVDECEVIAINYSAVNIESIRFKEQTDKNGICVFKDMDTGVFGGDRYAIFVNKKLNNTQSLFGVYPYLQLIRNEKISITVKEIRKDNVDFVQLVKEKDDLKQKLLDCENKIKNIIDNKNDLESYINKATKDSSISDDAKKNLEDIIDIINDMIVS